MSIIKKDVQKRQKCHLDSCNIIIDHCVLDSFVILNGPLSQDLAKMTNRQIGPGEYDFWLIYPSTRADRSSEVPHSLWIISALDQGPVMIMKAELVADLAFSEGRSIKPRRTR